MIKPQRKDIDVDINRNWDVSFAVYQSAGVVLDMTGYTIAAQIREGESKTSPLIATLTATWVSQANGQFTLSLAADSVDESHTKGFWDLKVTDTLARDYTWFYGVVNFNRRPTV